MRKKVVIVGGGVSGLATAIILAECEMYDITIIEKGHAFEERNASVYNNIVCGLGGAGTLGGGKFCFPPASGGIWEKTRIQTALFQRFLDRFFDNNEKISDRSFSNVMCMVSACLISKDYESCYILENDMRDFVQKLIKQNIEYGTRILCDCNVVSISDLSDKYHVTYLDEKGSLCVNDADYVVFAGGRESAKDIGNILHGVRVEYQRPDLGIRISLDRNKNEKFSIPGKDIKLKSSYEGHLVRTFCVCSGGDAVKAEINGKRYYDGHFGKELTEVVNLGLLARSSQNIYDVYDYLECFQKYIDEKFTLDDFMRNHIELANGTSYGPLFKALALFARKLIETGCIEQDPRDIPLYLPSADRFNPYVETDSCFMSKNGIYVIGDAAGISRGFVQAMWSGYCAAEALMRNEIEERKISVK